MNCALHPERVAIQPCDRCGNFGCAQCLASAGSQQLCSSCRARWSELEWDHRRELGLVRAWWLTTRRVMVSPLQTFDVISPQGNLVESVLYAGLSALVGILPTMIVYAAGIGGMLAFGAFSKSSDPKLGLLAGTGIGVAALLLYLAMFVAGSIVSLLGFAALEVLILRMTGAPTADYTVAVRAHALSMAAYVIGVLPICSIYVFPIYSVVLRVFAVQRLQRTTAGSAVAAALIPMGLCCTLCFGGYAALFAFSTAFNPKH